jgi:hypothetical protein
MFRLGRLLISCLTLAIVLWFVVSVPIGKHTLWGHLVRIAGTPEARDLKDGAKAAAKDAAQRVASEVKSVAPPPGAK